LSFALLFPGQGSQFPGMGANYLRDFPYLKDIFLEANEVLNFNILNLCLNGPEDTLNLTANAQPAILILSYCSYQILQKETNIKPFLMAGHSLGEISALCCSGAISFTDAVKIVRKRGELMQLAVSAGNGAMLAVNGLTFPIIQDMCSEAEFEGKVVISNINSPEQIVISGERDGVEKIGSRCRAIGAVTVPLKVSAPFHSPLMQPVAAGLEEELNNYTFSKFSCPVMSNVTCRPYMDENEIVPLLTEQVTTMVNWVKIMEYIKRTSVNITIELLPKKTLTRLFQSQKSGITSYSFDKFEEIKSL
jgi:[acyl-carrier-protein] S-malonyltransferase